MRIKNQQIIENKRQKIFVWATKQKIRPKIWGIFVGKNKQ